MNNYYLQAWPQYSVNHPLAAGYLAPAEYPLGKLL